MKHKDGPEGLNLIKTIGQKMKEVTGERRSTFYLSQIGISIAIQIENANCVQDPNFYLKDSVDVFCGTRTLNSIDHSNLMIAMDFNVKPRKGVLEGFAKLFY